MSETPEAALGARERLRLAVPRIVAWDRQVRRPLPWRENPTPYQVWISEIMLQQTRIEAAKDYYARFIRALPDIPALAAVEDDRLMKLWQGLGYYSRARNLKKAAQLLVERYDGELPQSAEALRRLPGIGDYTAGAIASMAYGQPEPAVDGNVLRVLARVLEDGEDVLQQSVRKRMTALLRAVYPGGEDAALLTEGLMELGETLCLPKGELKCAACPIRELCLARLHGTAEQYPRRAAPRERRVEEKTVLLLRSEGKFALCRRPEKGLLAGLWELPNLEGYIEPEELRRRIEEQGAVMLSLRDCGEARHVFTHVEWRMRGWLLDCAAPFGPYTWADGAEIARDYSIPTAFRAYTRLMETKL